MIPLGGTVLTAVAALAAFWPRRGRTGFPLVALILLVTLYAVPAVALDFEGEFLRGALLALLVLAFLRLERLRLTEARGAALLAAGTAIAALIAAPALDRDTPWWDYETWALSTAASHSTSFSWDHDYGPLDWPRDGREMLRVKARRPAYWKAESLDIFDGRRWREARSGAREAIDYALPANPAARDRWTQRIEVNVRNLRTRTFVTAGIATDAPKMPQPRRDPQRPERASGRRAARCAAATPTACRSTRRGRPSASWRPRARTTTATSTRSARSSSTTTAPPLAGRSRPRCDFPEWDDDAAAVAGQAPRSRPRAASSSSTASEALADSQPAAHLGALAASSSAARTTRSSTSRRSRPTSAAASPTRSPRRPPRARSRASCSRPSRATASSTRARWRCCCGWPASRRAWRPASPRARSTARPRSTSCATSTRTPGSRRGSPTSAGSRSTRRRPPRPRARRATSAARRRSATRPTSAAAARSTRAPGRPRPRARTGGRSSAAASRRWRCSSSAASPSAAAAAAPRRSPSSSARCAARAARPGPGATLQALEDSFARSPAAAAYVRALREQRYGGRGGEPTLAQRRGLRSELGRGGGPIGRLRAWWALPPRPSMPSARRRTIDAHG